MRRGFAYVALVVLGLGQLLGFEHLATARHVRCAEHGELVEAGSAPRPTGTAGVVPAEGASGDHDHCAFTAVLHQGATTSAPATALPAPPARPPAAPSLPAPPAPRALLYRLAPKTSPPV